MGRREQQASAIDKIAGGGGDFELEEATRGNATVKAALFGPPGSGKTFTATALIIGLHKHLKSKKPVTFLDTERGSDFVLKQFSHNKIKVLRKQTRAFRTLIPFLHKSAEIADIAIIDSITHFWQELCEAYKEAVGRKMLQIDDWGILKAEWNAFMVAFINCPIHLFMLGRGGFDYDYMDDGSGKQVLFRSGTKMVAEKNTQFEPSLTLEMNQVLWTDQEKIDMIKNIRKGIQPDSRGKIAAFEMTVLKDRSNAISGSRFFYETKTGGHLPPDNQMFKDIFPFIKELAIGKAEGQIGDEGSAELFGDQGKGVSEMRRRAKKALDEIEQLLVLQYPGSGATERGCKLEILNVIFETPSWEKIKHRRLEELEVSVIRIKTFIESAQDQGAEMVEELEGAGYDTKTDPKRLFIFAMTGQKTKFKAMFDLWKQEGGQSTLHKLLKKAKPSIDDVEAALQLSEFPIEDGDIFSGWIMEGSPAALKKIMVHIQGYVADGEVPQEEPAAEEKKPTPKTKTKTKNKKKDAPAGVKE